MVFKEIKWLLSAFSSPHPIPHYIVTILAINVSITANTEKNAYRQGCTFTNVKIAAASQKQEKKQERKTTNLKRQYKWLTSFKIK